MSQAHIKAVWYICLIMKNSLFILPFLVFFSCKKNVELQKPSRQTITESVYASGIIKAKGQYQAFASASGIVSELLVSEGDTVKQGQALLKIFNRTQQLTRENAELASRFSNLDANAGKLIDAKQQVELAYQKLKIDSALYFRQQALWQQQVGTKVELEQRELAFQNSKSNYYSSKIKADDLKRQLELNAGQSLRQLEITAGMEDDYVLKSELNGVVYELFKEKGEIVNPQTPLAIVGEAGKFILSMQVDEYDIFLIQPGLKVLVTMDSYKGKVFEAQITRIYPIMNERSKSFQVEAEFIQAPPVLYPNVSFEANIVLRKKDNALLIPRNCLVNDSSVIMADGKERLVKTGLKDFQMIEIISGLNESDEIQKPKK